MSETKLLTDRDINRIQSQVRILLNDPTTFHKVVRFIENEIINKNQDGESGSLKIQTNLDSEYEIVGHFYQWELDRSLETYPDGFPNAVPVYSKHKAKGTDNEWN